MRLLADENFPRPAVVALREAGVDVLWIAETGSGMSDDEVLAQCIATHRTLLTFDKDFGELAYRRSLPSGCGIILFRITPQTPDEVAALAVAATRISALLGWLLQRRHANGNPGAAPSIPHPPTIPVLLPDPNNWFQTM